MDPRHGDARTTPDGLGATSWQLVRFQGSDGAVLTPDDSAKYTVAFAADGAVSVRFDCNRGRGTRTSPGPQQLQLGRSRSPARCARRDRCTIIS
jgi:META domain-containing protein